MEQIRIIKIDDGIGRDFFCDSIDQVESFLKFKPNKYMTVADWKKKSEKKKKLKDSDEG